VLHRAHFASAIGVSLTILNVRSCISRRKGKFQADAALWSNSATADNQPFRAIEPVNKHSRGVNFRRLGL
jgi:hypothetical protein